MSECTVTLKCPFCLTGCLEAEPGFKNCRDCNATFEIDDRGECIFGDTENMKLPAIGTICGRCGLIQDVDVRNCLYCGFEINTTLQ
jgi:hypothetical protein